MVRFTFMIVYKMIVLRADMLTVSLKTKKLRYNCNISGEIVRSIDKMGSNKMNIKEIKSSGLIDHN